MAERLEVGVAKQSPLSGLQLRKALVTIYGKMKIRHIEE